MDLDSNYHLARWLLLRPCLVFEVHSLREVLALIHGAAIAKCPPHGSGFLPGFCQFVQHRLNGPPCAEYITLLKHYGHMPWMDGCAAVLALLDEWRETIAKEQN